jgi:hypothetical protein
MAWELCHSHTAVLNPKVGLLSWNTAIPSSDLHWYVSPSCGINLPSYLAKWALADYQTPILAARYPRSDPPIGCQINLIPSCPADPWCDHSSSWVVNNECQTIVGLTLERGMLSLPGFQPQRRTAFLGKLHQ